jgi:CubicO group peptidase (beta-lactamase class C family)
MNRLIPPTSLCLFLGFAAGSTAAAAETASLALPRSSPEAQGVSSAALRQFVEAADQSIEGMNSLMLVRHGHVIAEGWWAPYNAQSRHSLYSLSKSFTSTAVGLAVAEGRMTIDDTILSHFPDEAPAEPSEHLKGMRVRDLLSMSTGHQTEPSYNTEQRWTKTFLAEPVPHKPGTHFLYNTAATYMLSAIVQKTTGLTVLDYLRPRLFEPLGIEDPTWGTSPQGVSLGGYGLSIRTEDIARFGQLYLQKGEWHGRQLLPAAWIQAATSRQVSNGSNPQSDWDQGYGYQFWRCRHGAFRGDGAFGQYCVVMPDQDAVLAITSGVKDMQAVLNLVWDKLLPALGSAAPLSSNEAERDQLQRKLADLVLPTQSGSASASIAAELSSKKYLFPTNTQGIDAIGLEFERSGEPSLFRWRLNGVDQQIPCGFKTWRKGHAAYGALTDQPAAASGAWTSDDTYLAKLCFYETPFCITIKLKFSGEQVFYDAEYNVGFSTNKQPQLIGRLQH